jgi:hypothetical protein
MKPAWPSIPVLPVAWGEVFDKLTILEIKLAALRSEEQRANVAREKASIEGAIGDRQRFPAELDLLVQALHAINLALWAIEDGKRACEKAGRFDAYFVQLARDVYLKNDERARIKRQINTLLGSGLVEEKSHTAGT